MRVTAMVADALNGLLSKLSSQRTWASNERLARGAKHFAAMLSAVSQGDEEPAGDVSDDATRGTLHVISGRHRGACIELAERSYLIGSGEHCDIVLRDDRIADRHCLVTLARDGFSVQDVCSPDPQALPTRRVTHSDRTVESEYEVGGVLIMLTQHLPQDDTSAVEQPQATWRSAPWPIAALAIVGAMLIISALVGVRRAIEPASAEQIAARVVSASEALAEQGFASVHFRAGAGGNFEVTGFVADLTEETRLRQWLERENYSDVQVSVRLVSQLIDDVRHVLSDDALQVGVNGGHLRIDGTTHQPPVKSRIRTLTTELQGLVEIDDRVVYAPGSIAPGPLPVRLRGVMLDEPHYFVTDSGARYFVGGVLPDGSEVVAIAADGIRFQKDGKTILYSLE